VPRFELKYLQEVVQVIEGADTAEAARRAKNYAAHNRLTLLSVLREKPPEVAPTRAA
jgi:hypothetical protein